MMIRSLSTCVSLKRERLSVLKYLKCMPVPGECDQNYIKYMQYLQGTNFTKLSLDSIQYQRIAVPSSAITQAVSPQAEMPCICKGI